MNDTFVVKAAYGGLGDHLFYSHLPRIAKQCGYRRVVVSNRSDFRHADYRRLIWESNPYVDGFTDEDAPSLTLGAVKQGTNLLDAIMRFRGLDDGRLMHEPELHFQPAPEPKVSGATVYDPNFVSYVGEVYAADVDRFLEERGVVPDFMLTVRGKAAPSSRYGRLLQTTSFEHYCSVIRSADRFICLTSGGATLAASLGKPVEALWGSGQNTMFHHSAMHTYVNVHPNFADRHFPRLNQAWRGAYLRTRASIRRIYSLRHRRDDTH